MIKQCSNTVYFVQLQFFPPFKPQWSSNVLSGMSMNQMLGTVSNQVLFLFPAFLGFLVLRSFLLPMPEKPFLALTSPSTRPHSKSASDIKRLTYLCPTCQLKHLFLRKMDGLQITFHRPLSCPPITWLGQCAILHTGKLSPRVEQL